MKDRKIIKICNTTINYTDLEEGAVKGYENFAGLTVFASKKLGEYQIVDKTKTLEIEKIQFSVSVPAQRVFAFLVLVDGSAFSNDYFKPQSDNCIIDINYFVEGNRKIEFYIVNTKQIDELDSEDEDAAGNINIFANLECVLRRE